MKNFLVVRRLGLILALAALAGCATPFTGALDLKAPPPGEITTLRSQSVLIRNVTDDRAFAEAAGAADAPVLLEEDLDEAPSAVKARAIGCANGRNVMLPPGQTIEALVRETLGNIFSGLGFQIETDTGMLSGGDIIVDVTIEEFWGWIEETPGSLIKGKGRTSLEGRITTRLNMVGPLGQKSERTIQANARNRRDAAATGTTWRKLYRLLLEEYSNLARQGLSELPQP